MIKIYGHPATSAGRCFWALEEIGSQYEIGSVDMRNKEHKSPSFLEKNPNGKIPVLEDGDFVLWESVAINQYLAEKYKPELLGSTLEDRAKVYQWSCWSQIEYQKPLIDLFIQLVFVPEDKRDSDVIEKAQNAIKPLNKILDEALTGRSYLVGSEFSMADLNVASVAKINKRVNIDLGQYSQLDDWLTRVMSRPAAMKLNELSQQR